MRAETLKGHLDLLLLAVVAEGPTHGYAIIDELRTRSGEAFDLPEGTVYPALHRLQRSGLLTSTWDSSSGRRRRVYRLTDDGRRALASEHRDWGRFVGAVTQVLEGTPWPDHA